VTEAAPGPADPGDAGPPRFARAARMISGATMLSRVLGLVREQLAAALLGATMFADAFVVAFRIPNLLRDLFAEGALSQAFVPTFKAELKQRGTAAAYALANRVAGNLTALIAIILVGAALFTPEIVAAMTDDNYARVPGQVELTVLLTRIMLPFLLLISLAAVSMGILNAQDRYGAPALAPAMFNVACIATGLFLWATDAHGPALAIGWSIGTLLGGLAQLWIQTPFLWRAGYRPRLRLDVAFRDPGVRRIARLMGPAVVGLAALQLNVFVNTLFATSEPGAAAWLNYAFRFLQLPIGVFGVAVGVVATTRFSDAAADGDRPLMARQLVEALRVVLFLTVPATVGLLVMGEPIIQLIYERGRFGPTDTIATTRALDLYIVGLVAYAAVKVVAPAFYAVNRARVPLVASVTAVATNVVMSVALHPTYGYRILALGTAAAALVNFTVLYALFQRQVAPVAHRELLGHLVRVGAAAALMGGAVWGAHVGLVRVLGDAGFGARLVTTVIPIAGGVVAYALACRALRVPELAQFSERISRRRR
jgi:putative peptidoglycan lipid II flippase